MKIPRATYRLQFNADFNFAQARELAPYLAELGISDIYASPIFKARRGSRHGYDVVDFNRLNPELGSEADFQDLISTLKGLGLGWIQDLVPNHMAYDGENPMLMDIFENGPRSAYYNFFDVDWEHHYENIRGKLLAPILGRRYGEAIEAGEIKLSYDAAGFSINYYDKKFPLRIDTYATIIGHRLQLLSSRLGEDHIEFIKLLGILHIIKNLSGVQDEDFASRYDQAKIIKSMLWEVYTKNTIIMHFIDENVDLFCGTAGHPESFQLLDNLLAEQIYSLAYWKVATEELNYRRFFTINDLISVKIENLEVFSYTHNLILQLIAGGSISGLRIDHIDGLYDPSSYLERLSQQANNLYIVVEKILALDEELPATWPVQGTTGYDFLNYCNSIFCNARHAALFNNLYSKYIGAKVNYPDLVYAKKKLIIEKYMTGDVDNLAQLLKNLAAKYRHGSDISLYSFKRVIIEVLALFPVYRTYLNHRPCAEPELFYLKQALHQARTKNPDLGSEFDFLEELICLTSTKILADCAADQVLHFIMRLQQLSGPLMAKGFEDTTLYIYNRLISLNEVGGDPYRFGLPIKEFHHYNQRKVKHWPHALNATATHDTKRGEDVRARINVLSEIPEDWEKNLKKWTRLNKKHKKIKGAQGIPDKNDEYLLYQTLIGAFPFDPAEYPSFVERIKQYMIKAVREAKIHTGWTTPDTEYEATLLAFIDDILAPTDSNQFLDEFLPFQKLVAHYGMFNSLSQTLLKITCPGVPDFYQGTELWELNLVDPDNRRPVDFDLRRQFLNEIKERGRKEPLALINDLWASREDGRLKLFLIYQALQARRQHEQLFQAGSYLPVPATGKYKDQVVSFLRIQKKSAALVVLPRLLTAVINTAELPLGLEIWQDTAIILPQALNNGLDSFTGRSIDNQVELLVGDLLSHFCAALVISP
ncbi:MAG: malto-oligosyltrehalose synthase [Desulfobacca sp. 4484_104]|nr:MAG: malto-oligosyltrehalose synthase [Desulfobacca sp. 4484_104]